MKNQIRIYVAIAILFGLSTSLQAQCFDMSMARTDYSDKTCFQMEVTFERSTGLGLTGGVTLSDNVGNQRVCLFNSTTTTWCYDKPLAPLIKKIKIECESEEREVTLPNGNIILTGCAVIDGCTVLIFP